MSGGFGYQNRTGASKDSIAEVVLNTLNSVRGTAYDCSPGTIVYVENMAIARVIADAWETCRRFGNQFDPDRMTSFLERWEKIFNIIPLSTATMNDRRRIVSAKFKMFNMVPLLQSIKDFLKFIEGDVFLDILRTSAEEGNGSVPGGATLPGGVTLTDGFWLSNVANIAIRLYQPLGISDGTFYDEANKFSSFIDSFLPAWETYNWGRYTYVPPGTISVAFGSKNVTGSSTLFLTDTNPLVIGDEIEVYDDNQVLRTLLVDIVGSNTTLTLKTPAVSAITSKTFKIKGFVLDQPLNLDNAFLDK